MQALTEEQKAKMRQLLQGQPKVHNPSPAGRRDMASDARFAPLSPRLHQELCEQHRREFLEAKYPWAYRRGVEESWTQRNHPDEELPDQQGQFNLSMSRHGTFLEAMFPGHKRPEKVQDNYVGKCKLTYEVAQQIREKRKAGASTHELATAFGVSKSTVLAVLRLEFWKPKVSEALDAG